MAAGPSLSMGLEVDGASSGAPNVLTLENATLTASSLGPLSRRQEEPAVPACPKARWRPVSSLPSHTEAIHAPVKAAARLPSPSMATPAHASLWSRSRR